MSCDRKRRLLEQFLEDFYVKEDTDPEVDSPVALGKFEFFYDPISRIFSVTVNSNQEVDSPMESHGSVRARQDVPMAVAAGGCRSSSHKL